MVSAIILAAGRGTRMRDDSHNKVCFDCAGVSVIRRIILNMKAAGVQQIVVVVGHMAQDVMDALDGISGVFYAYQKVQNGSGSAAMIGMKLLKDMGFQGNVIVSVGDKIVSPEILRDYVAMEGKAIYSVQKTGINPNGGRIAYRNGKPYGIYEFPDAALLKVWPMPREKWAEGLRDLGMNDSKIEKVVKKADGTAENKGWFVNNGNGCVKLCGEVFTADELLNSPYTNLALYRFDLDAALKVLQSCTPKNVQGEIYVTDTMEHFAATGDARLYVVENANDILTYSTKPELIAMSRHFMRRASELKCEADERKDRLLDAFIDKYGDREAVITRAPGRVNILGRHIDHRGGNTNVMAIDNDTMIVASPRDDRMVVMSNVDSRYPDYSFEIDLLMGLAPHDDWVGFIESMPVRLVVEGHRGAWINYVMAAVARFQFSSDLPLLGMDLMVHGNIPVAAGLSSSSSIVVAVAEAIVALNCLAISTSQFIDMCGEGEWFVGTRGGAGDQAAMKCSEEGRITQLGFKPFYVGSSEVFSEEYAIIVADSNIKSNKATGSRDKFNAQVAAYELSFMLMKKYFPEYDMVELRDAARIRPYSNIYKMLKRVPERATREELLELMPENRKRILQIFNSHSDPGYYNLRGAALFGISECERSRECLDYLEREDYTGLGDLMKISHNGDRVSKGFPMRITDEYLIHCIEKEADVALQPGAYECSLPEIDALCDMLNETRGVLGSQMLGAGLGGCLAVLVKREETNKVIEKLNREYYDRHGYPHLAKVYRPGRGSSVEF